MGSRSVLQWLQGSYASKHDRKNHLGDFLLNFLQVKGRKIEMKYWGIDRKYIREWEDEDKVQVRDGVKCEKAAPGNNKVWLHEAVSEVMHWGDGDLVRGQQRWEEIPRRALLCLCLSLLWNTVTSYLCGKKELIKEQPYLCNLSSSSSRYLVVFSFSRVSAWKHRHKRKSILLLLLSLAAFIGRDVVS